MKYRNSERDWTYKELGKQRAKGRKMAKWSDMVEGGQYLRGADIDGKGDINVTISHVTIDEMPNDNKKKAVIHFRGAEKGLVLNVTNGETIKDAYGDDMDQWNGKPLILFTIRTQTPDGTPVKGIRCRCPGAKNEAAPIDAFSNEALDDPGDLPF